MFLLRETGDSIKKLKGDKNCFDFLNVRKEKPWVDEIDQMRSYINKSIIHSIIDIVIGAPATEPEQRMLTSMRRSHPGIQWLPCGCSSDLLKNGDWK